MNKDELLAELNVKSFFFNEDQGPVLYFEFDGGKYTHTQLKKLAVALDALLADEPNIFINKEAKKYKYQVLLTEKQGNGVVFDSLSGMELDYNEVLAKKASTTPIRLGFYLFNVRVQQTEEKIFKIRSHEDYDPTDVMTGEEDYYINMKLPVGKKTFTVHSDDDPSEGPAAFEDVAPEIALAITAPWREEQEKKDQ